MKRDRVSTSTSSSGSRVEDDVTPCMYTSNGSRKQQKRKIGCQQEVARTKQSKTASAATRLQEKLLPINSVSRNDNEINKDAQEIDVEIERNNHVDDIDRNNNNNGRKRIQELIWQIKQCGSDLSKCLAILSTIRSSASTCTNSLSQIQLYEDCYIAALQVCTKLVPKNRKQNNKKRRNNKETQTTPNIHCRIDEENRDIGTDNLSINNKDPDIVLLVHKTIQFVLDSSPTESCLAKSICIYGLMGDCNAAIGLFKSYQNIIVDDTDARMNHRSLQAVLATCVPTGQWKLALEVLLSGQQITTSCCNIILNAMCSDNAGFDASEILQNMIQQNEIVEKRPISSNSEHSIKNNVTWRWPRPDRHSFLYTMNALIRQQSNHKSEKKSLSSIDGMTTNNEKYCDTSKAGDLFFIDKAYDILNEMLRYGQQKQGDDERNFLRPNHANLDLLIRAYRQHGDEEVADYINDKLRSQFNDLNEYPHPKQIRIEMRRIRLGNPSLSTNTIMDQGMTEEDNEQSFAFSNWYNDSERLGFVKHGRGREAYWAFATYCMTDHSTSYTVALQPHRDPSNNGIKILLFDNNDGNAVNNSCNSNNHLQDRSIVFMKNDSNKKKQQHAALSKSDMVKKVGFLLLINSSLNSTSSLATCRESEAPAAHGKSSLLGLYLDPAYRKRKLSKVFLAMWLDLCWKANLIPETGVMNKPLLALVLQDTFGFSPVGKRGFDVQIVNDSSNTHNDTDLNTLSQRSDKNSKAKQDGRNNDEILKSITLFSPSSSRKLVGGAFANIDLKHQNIQLITEEPPSHSLGRVCRLGCCLSRSTEDATTTSSTALRSIIDKQIAGPNGLGRIMYYSDHMPWINLMLGK